MSKTCLFCSADIEDSATVCPDCYATCPSGPAPESAEADAGRKPASRAALVMTDLHTGKALIINESCIIGREGNLEPGYFAGNRFVSGQHCRIIAEDSGYKVEHLSKVNPTKLNNDELPRRIGKVIRNNDLLTIANMTFEISIGQNDQPGEAAIEEEKPQTGLNLQDDATVANPTRFLIICPKCKAEYEVTDINAQIPECDKCADDYDKYEIAKVRAREG